MQSGIKIDEKYFP